MNARADYDFYKVGKIIWLPSLIFGFVFSYWGYDRFLKDRAACAFKSVTGLPCPGCGGTRAFVSLFRGEFFRSFIYNPTVWYAVLAYAHFMALFFYRLHIKKNIISKPIHTSYYAYGLVCVIILQWILKLIYIFFIL